MMEFQLDQAVEILQRTPAILNALLRGLADDWIHNNEGGESWSPHAVVGHLIHGEETDWIPRAKIILERGETKPFEPFDRFAMFEKSKGKSLSELLATFARLREENLRQLEEMNLTPELLAKRGTHPELGTVTLGQLLALRVGRLKDEGKYTPSHVSMAKRNNVRMALDIAREARSVLGASGISLEFPIFRHMCNLESVYTYEGTHDMHSLILGEAITGHSAF